MKNILLLSLLLVSFSAFTQSKQQDVQNLLTVLKIKPTMLNMVNTGIDLYKRQKPLVPQNTWDNIKNLVDYTLYVNKIAGIFNNNYTQPELKHLIILAQKAKPGKQPKFKPAVKTLLYNAGNEFGKQFASLIKEELRLKGY